MPEDEIKQMAKMLGQSNDEPAETKKRSNSDGDAKGSSGKSKDSKKSCKVDCDRLNLGVLETFIRMVTNDDTSMSFFADLPGFSYQFARYTDWIGAFIHDIAEQDAKDSKKLTRDQKSNLKDIQVLYSRFLDYVESREKASSDA